MKLTITANDRARVAAQAALKITDYPAIFNWQFVRDQFKAKMPLCLIASDWPLTQQSNGVLVVERDDEFSEIVYDWRPNWTYDNFSLDALCFINRPLQTKMRDNPTLIRMAMTGKMLAQGVPLLNDWPWAPTEGRLILAYDDEFSEFIAGWEKEAL